MKPGRDANEQDALQELPVQAQLSEAQREVPLPQQHNKQHPGADDLAEDGSEGRPGHSHAAIDHQHNVHNDIHNAGRRQGIHRCPGVPHGPQDPRLHIVNHRGQGPGKVDPQVGPGHLQAFLRRLHPGQDRGAQAAAHCRYQQAQDQRQGEARVKGPVHSLGVIGPIELGQDHGGAGAEAGKEAAEHIDQRSCGAYRRQGPGADKTAHNDGVHCVVHLLKKSAQQDRKEENQDLFPDDPFCDLPGGRGLAHAGTSAFF